MAETLYLRLPAGEQSASWLLVDTLGNRVGRVQHGDLAEVAPQARGRHVCVLVPGSEVSLLHADIPTRNLQKVLQAVPYALEDRLAEEIDALHFALGRRDATGFPVATLRRNRLEQWLAELAAADIEADELVPVTLALPAHDATIDIVLDNSELLVHMPNGNAFSADRDFAPMLIERQLAAMRSGASCEKAILHVPDGTDTASLNTALSAMGLEVQIIPLNDGILPVFAATLHGIAGLNLLQGSYSRRKDAGERWLRWRFAVALLAAFCVIGIVQQSVTYFQLRHQAAQLDAEVAEQFHKALPDEHRLVNARVQMQQRLNKLSGGGGSTGPLAMLGVLGTALQSNSKVQLSGFSYHNGTLQVDVQAAEIQTLDDLKTALQQAGKFNVNLDSVNSSNGQATGRLTMTGGAA